MDKVNTIKKRLLNKLMHCASALLICLFPSVSLAQYNITAVPQTYTQNFDAALGTASLTWTNNTTVTGWYITNASPLPINTGTINSNSCYNFGIAGTNPLTDRALGAISTATTHRFGIRMANTSGSPINSFDISFTGEQWRSFNAGTLVFEYQTGTTVTSLTAGTWTALTALDFTNLTTSGGAATDGNNATYRTAKSATLTVTVATGTEIFFRWSKLGTSSPGLAIDDLTITANNSGVPNITLSTSTLTGFSYFVGAGPSTNQTFTCSGANLTNDITLTAPADYEISTSSGSGFGASLTLTQAAGTVSSTTIYVRLISGLAINSYNAEVITASSTGATSQTVTCSGNVVGSTTSDIITFGGEAATIASTVNTASPLNSGTGVQVWQFKVRDGGATLSDADNLPTILNAFTISQAAGNAVTNWSTAIKTIELFDGTTNLGVGTVTTGPNQIAFTGLSSSVADNTEKIYSLRLSLNCGIGSTNFDGDDFGFQISNGNVTFSAAGSGKAAFAATSTTNGQNVISVVATELQFVQQPTTTGNNTSMTPSVTVKASDACGNTDLGFVGTVSITSTGTLTGSPVTATAVAGVATFAGLTHTVVGTNFTLTAASAGLSSSVSSNFDITTVTNFGTGDIAIVGMCVDINGCGGSTTAGEDELSFVSFEDITPGTTIDITDNGFERKNCSSNTWGNSEGVIRITRTTSTLPKGTIVTLRILDQTIFSAIQPDANWTVTYPNAGYGTFNMNSTDEQIYIMQGGSWYKGASSGSHDATYTGGTLMFAINTYSAWTCNNNLTTRGDLPLNLKCFSILPGIATKNIKYTGPVTPAAQKDWIDRLNSASNWTGTNTCAAYVSGGLDYGGTSQTYTILAGGFNSGYWTGASNTDWYDCNNWQNYKVPDSLANVTIDNVTNDPIIGASPTLYPNGAVCNDLSITSTSGAGVLTMNNSASYLSIKGNVSNNGTITSSAGTTDFRSANAQTISGTGASTFYSLRLNNTHASGVTLSQNITAANSLTFINGMLSTGANRMIITNTTTPTIIGYGSSKFINGNLRQSIASNTATYVFPIGDGMATTNYKRADFVNNILSGVGYIDASVNTITETAPNDDATFAAAAQTQGVLSLAYIAENAEWDLSPDFAPSGGDYGVRLYVANTGVSATDDDQFFAVKRPSTSTTYADWLSYDASTTVPAAGAAGRIYNSGNGYAERLGYTSFSKHAIATVLSPLPIELLRFTAAKQNNTVLLNWSTATETNNDYFTIEKSKDAVEFTELTTIDGAGNSSVAKNYSTTDFNPISGINYYRLKQTDFNGSISYSGTVAVSFDVLLVETVYPNPAVDCLNIRLSGNNSQNPAFEILNALGNVVLKPKLGFDEEGTIVIHLETLPAGTYILKTITAEESKQILFIKQ